MASKNAFNPCDPWFSRFLNSTYRYLFTNVYFVWPVMQIAGISEQHSVGHGIDERKQSGNDTMIGYLWRKI
jgi:hypothetical protein